MSNIKEIIKAWVNGKTIQVKSKHSEHWSDKISMDDCIEDQEDVIFNPTFFDYRIKPEEVVRYVIAEHFEEALMRNRVNTAYQPMLHKQPLNATGNIKLTFLDNVLTKAEVV